MGCCGFFWICLFICGFGWHCAVSQLVCLQWMPYDDGFSHLCSTASDIAVTYVCSSPPEKPFQGKAMSVGNKHRPDPCNQCFSWVALPSFSSGYSWCCPLASKAYANSENIQNNLLAKKNFVGRTLLGGTLGTSVTWRSHLIGLIRARSGQRPINKASREEGLRQESKFPERCIYFFPRKVWAALYVSLSIDTNFIVPLTK